MTPTYEVIAIRYAARKARRGDNFIGGDPHDGDMPMDYFLWLVRNHDHLLLVDTGFNEDMAIKRNRVLLRRPVDGLRLLGAAPETIRQIIITHFHNDHVGAFSDFPAAMFHVQDDEMAFATGRHMRHERFRRSFEPDHVAGMVHLLFKERVVFHKGDDAILPGISVHQIGGHTPGMQCVRIHTKRGWLVLASDASHYYENIETNRCFPVVYNVGDVLEGYDKIRRLAESPKHIIPGHDPIVMRRYPAAGPDLDGIAVRLDAEPFD